MLTTEQIRTLNDARTILQGIETPRDYYGGRVETVRDTADNAVFQVLNFCRAYLGMPISEEQMHNKEGDRARHLGSADLVQIVGDEDGFELHLSTDRGRYVINVHGVAEEILSESSQISEWLEEGGRASAERRHDAEQADAYDLRNPKHPEFHSTHADLWDARKADV